MTKELKDLQVLEVSLVKRPANKRKILMLKEEGGIFVNEEVLKSILDTELENEEKIEGVLKAENMSDDARNAIRGALRILQAFREELPNALLNQLGNLLGNGEIDMGKKESKKEGEKMKKEDISKMNLPDEVKEQLSKLWKENEEYMKKANELNEMLLKEKDEKVKKEFIEKASEFKQLSIKPDEFGLVMKGLSEKAPDEYKEIERLLKSVDEQLGQGEVFKEKGSNFEGNTGGVWSKIENIAKSLMESDKSLSEAKAITKALEENPNLYSEWLKEGGK